MATIIERGGRFLARVRINGKATSKTFTRMTDALAWARRTEADIESGRWTCERTLPAPASTIPTLQAAIVEYRIQVASKMKSAKDGEYRLLQLAAAPFASKQIDKIAPVEISEWRD
jgi:hypothetical protein